MNITLPPQLEELIEHEVASGRYKSAEEVLIEALRIWKVEDLRREVLKGIEELERGEYESYDDETLGQFFDEIRAAE